MAAPTIEQLTALAAALGLGGIAAKAIDWWARRHDEARREPASMTRAAAELMDSLSDGGKELLDEFRTEFRYLRNRVVELQAEVDKGKADAAVARALAEVAQGAHAKCEAEVSALRSQIQGLMAATGPAADYTTLRRFPDKPGDER